MALPLPFADSDSESASLGTPEPAVGSVTIEASVKSVPIDPFAYKITSWEEWSAQLKLPVLQYSTSLPKPPKVDLFSSDPLPFKPRPRPSKLESYSKDAEMKMVGQINLFGSKPTLRENNPQQPVQEMDGVQIEDTVPLDGGIRAPPVNDDARFKFDWPSEDIRRACEEFFPGRREWILPVLNWIPPEQHPQEQRGTDDGESMQDIQH